MQKNKYRNVPWRGLCSPQCWTAKHGACACKCNGRFHGLGVDSDENQVQKVLKKQMLTEPAAVTPGIR